jgi:hypothetical protein
VEKEKNTMAKVAYSKLKLKVNDEIIPIQLGEDVTVGVKKYLPVQDKLTLISRVIELSHDLENNYSNPVKVEIYTTIEIIKAYTELSFTEKQEEDIPKLYDQLISSGAWDIIREAIPPQELGQVQWGIGSCIESIYKYRNSVLGVLDAIQSDYNETKLDVNGILEQLQSGEGMELVKEVMSNFN